MKPQSLTCAVECRASNDGPMLHGVVITEGRAARGGRAEVFAPGALTWREDGIGINLTHLAAPEVRAVPVREGNEIRISAKATPALFAAVNGGKRYMSVEFHPITETRTAGGIREIELALLTAATLTDDPEYHQTSAEVRDADTDWNWAGCF